MRKKLAIQVLALVMTYELRIAVPLRANEVRTVKTISEVRAVRIENTTSKSILFINLIRVLSLGTLSIIDKSLTYHSDFK